MYPYKHERPQYLLLKVLPGTAASMQEIEEAPTELSHILESTVKKPRDIGVVYAYIICAVCCNWLKQKLSAHRNQCEETRSES